MSTYCIPAVVAARLEKLAADPEALQHPSFAVSQLTFHQPGAQDRDSFGSWSMQGFAYEFRLIGQLSAHHTFVDAYGDMLYHKRKERYAGPWVMKDVVRAKRKFSIALPDCTTLGPLERVLQSQYQRLDDIQKLNYVKATEGLAVRARVKSSFSIRAAHQWRASVVSENIFTTERPSLNGGDWVNLQNIHDPDNIIHRLCSPDEPLFVNQLQAVDSAGAQVLPELMGATFRPGSWIELSCKLRVWTSSTHGEHARSYHIVTDGLQLLSPGTLDEGIVRSAPVSRPAKKRKFEPVTLSPTKRPRVDLDPPADGGVNGPAGLEVGLHGMSIGNP